MRCPTCSSPLPDGAMFCGQCGRAITAADVEAFRAQQEADSAVVAEPAGPEIPAWSLQEPPVAAVATGTPWWVSERAEVEEAVRPPGAEQAVPVAEQADPEVEQAPAVAEQADPEVEQAPALSPVRPQALRPPSSASGAAGRPSSAPLWTASLTPLEAEAPVHPAAADSTSDDTPVSDRSESFDDEHEPSSADGEFAGAEAADERVPDDPNADVESEPGTQAQAQASPSPEPRPGDTNVIAPLVSPSAGRSSGALRCTVCGAALADDDIFCGECGTVVASVAQSFTGPITPILTGTVRSDEAEPADEIDEPDSEANGWAGRAQEATEQPSTAAHAVADDEASAADSPAPRAAPRPAPLAPTPVLAADAPLPPFVPDPEPTPRRRRLFSRRVEQDAPKLWSAAPAVGDSRSPVPRMPSPGSQPARAEDESTPESTEKPIGLNDVPASTRPDSPPAPSAAPLAATPVDAPHETLSPSAPDVPAAPESPRSAAPWAVGAAFDDVEKTRIVPRQPLGDAFVLQFSTGESFTVQGTGLVGRAPTPQPGEAIDLLVRIVDPGKSVSKTHLEFGQETGALWVSDRWSGNGTVVRPTGGAARRCEPGKRISVPRGSRVEIGEQFFMVN